MTYQEKIEKRKSYRSFKDKGISDAIVEDIRQYYAKAKHLLSEKEIEMVMLSGGIASTLKGIAGYQGYVVEAPLYIIFLTRDEPHALENAGYIGEDIALHLPSLDLGSCWTTIGDAAALKKALSLPEDDLRAASVLAVGYPDTIKQFINLHFKNNDVTHADVRKRPGYSATKLGIQELVYRDAWKKTLVTLDDLDENFVAALGAAAQAPSYLNRQPYRFIIKDDRLYLVSIPDELVNDQDRSLGLGIVMLHFAAVYSELVHATHWVFDSTDAFHLAPGEEVVAYCAI